jgi:putative component of membrane protein insertase Oxa1/YidC/SpoIIIJ protein YidD
MKILIVQFYPASCYFIPVWSKYSHQCPVLKCIQSMFLP